MISGCSDDVKTIKGVKVDGKLLLRVMEEYVQKINSGDTPIVENIWDSVVNINNQERLEEVCEKLRADVKKIQLPVSRE